MALLVGYNPQPFMPDPFEMAFRLGYSLDPDGWDIGTALQRAKQANPAHRAEIDAAHMIRYNGANWDTPGPLGAEHETNIWPRVLQALYGGFPSAREVHDAAFFGTKAMVVEAFSLLRVPGYTSGNPIILTPGDPVWGAFLGSPDPAPGDYRVTAKPQEGEPAWFANYRDTQWEATLYYRVKPRPAVVVSSVPSVPSPGPSPSLAHRPKFPPEFLEAAKSIHTELKESGLLTKGGGRWAQALRRLLKSIPINS